MRINWTAEARRVLGLGRRQKLPQHGLPRVSAYGYVFYLKPQVQPELRLNGRKHRKPHRLFIICSCGKHLPAGRLAQHLRFHPGKLVLDYQEQWWER